MAAIKPFTPLDEKFPFDRQLGIAATPLVLINLLRSSIPPTKRAFWILSGRLQKS